MSNQNNYSKKKLFKHVMYVRKSFDMRTLVCIVIFKGFFYFLFEADKLFIY